MNKLCLARKLSLAMLALFCISAANALSVTGFEANPNVTALNTTVNISANVYAANNIDVAGFTIKYPDQSSEFILISLFFDFVSETIPEPIPYNITEYGKSYDLTIDCHDFTDDSNCYVLVHSVSENCVNVTFDDQPGGGDQDLDIGVLACVNETASGYLVNMTRWGYDAGNDVRARFCFHSQYAPDYCSQWILNNSGCGSTPNCYVRQIVITNLDKTVFGGSYLSLFDKTSQLGTYYLTFFVNDTEGNKNDTEETYFSIGEANPPRFLSWQIFPQECNALDPVLITTEVYDESKIDYVHALITGAENQTLQLHGEGNIYKAYYYPPSEGSYYITLSAKDTFNNLNNSFAGSISAVKPIFPPSRQACKNISSIGLVYGNTIFTEKLSALMRTSYYCTKNILGLWGYEYQIAVKYKNGTVLTIDGAPIIYGKAPPATKSIYVSKQTLLLSNREQVMLYLSIWKE